MTRLPHDARARDHGEDDPHRKLRFLGRRDLRALLHVPQHDLQSQLASRLERLGFPALRPAQVQLLSVIGWFGSGDADARCPAFGPRRRGLAAQADGRRPARRAREDADGRAVPRPRSRRDQARPPRPQGQGVGGRGQARRRRRPRRGGPTRLGTQEDASLRALLEELAATVEDAAAEDVERRQAAPPLARARPGSARRDAYSAAGSRAGGSRSDGATRSGRRSPT